MREAKWEIPVEYQNMNGHEPRVFDFLSPQGLISAASKAHPAFKYAVAAAGLASLVAVIATFGVSVAALVFGVIALVVLMVLFLVFSQAAVVSRTRMALPAMVLVWSFLILAILVAVLLASSTFFDKPLPLKTMIVGQLHLTAGAAKPPIPLVQVGRPPNATAVLLTLSFGVAHFAPGARLRVEVALDEGFGNVWNVQDMSDWRGGTVVLEIPKPTTSFAFVRLKALDAQGEEAAVGESARFDVPVGGDP